MHHPCRLQQQAKERVPAGGTARWGDAYLTCKGYQGLEQMGAGFPALPGHTGLQQQVGADSFQRLSQFLQPDMVPPSNPKFSVCLPKLTLPPRDTQAEGS